MRAVTLLYVVGLTLGYLPSTVAAPSYSDYHAKVEDHQAVDRVDKSVTYSWAARQPIASSSSSSREPTSSPHSHEHAQGNEHMTEHGHGQGHSHGHGSHHKPQVELNETDLHHWHHFPPSYLAADFRLSKDQVIFGEELDETWSPEDEGGHKYLALGHAGTFIVAYFGILPIALALRAAHHPIHHLVNLVFLAVATVSWLLVLGYRAATPDRYAGSSHAVLVNGLYFLSVGLTFVDWLSIVKRAINSRQSRNAHIGSWRDDIRQALDIDTVQGPKYGDRSRQYEMVGYSESDGFVFRFDDHEEDETDEGSRLRTDQHNDRSVPSRQSTGSDGTLHEAPLYEDVPLSHQKPPRMGAYDMQTEEPEAEHQDENDGDDVEYEARIKQPEPGLMRFGEVVLTWTRRTQVVIAYVTVLAGFIVYTGMCRANFLPSCMAHYIKGSIFFGYGVLTFARYLGAYADLGWAWNRQPVGKKGPTAEMVECAVIFVYGITQTWMERIGSHAGDPYTVKQVQHISIAVMFWFAGLGGMLLESKWMRRVMSNATGRTGRQVEPASYSFSFNPLPALVIAVTGLAMAAHHQNYVFQVEIHSLWGILLAGGSIFRMLTYFFLFLRPPVESELPSRPPTEILTSFGWAAGGIVFMLSNEEITFAAMRTGYDDMMAFLNFTVALTCAIFCWEVVVMGVKGWGVGRMNQRGERRAVRV